MKSNGNGNGSPDTRDRAKRKAPGYGYSVQEMEIPALSRFGIPSHDRTRSSGADLAASLGFSVSPFTGGETIQNLYSESLWIRAAIKAKSAGLGSLPFEVLDRPPEEKGARALTTHPLLALLANPNPLYTTKEFWRACATAYTLDGEVFWFLANRNGEAVAGDPGSMTITEAPALIIPVRGAKVKIERNALGFPTEFKYGGSSGSERVFSAYSVVQFIDHDPDNPLRGVGDAESALGVANLMFQAERNLESTIIHGGDPGAWITYDERIDPGELARRQSLWDDEATPENRGRNTVLEKTAKVTPKPVAAKFTEYPDVLQWFVKSMLSAIGVPPPVVGLYEEATYNNVTTAYREFWSGQNGVLALAGLFADVVQHRLIQRMAVRAPEWAGFAAFSSRNVSVLKEIRGDQLQKAVVGAVAGVGLSVNEGLRNQGVEGELPEHGDVHWISPTLVPVDGFEGVIPAPEPEAEPDEDDADAKDSKEKGGKKKAAGKDKADEKEKHARPTQMRSSRYRARNAPTRKPDEKLLAATVQWLSSYESAQLARIRAVALGKRGLDSSKLAKDLTLKDLELLFLSESQWAERMRKLTGGRIASIYKAAAGETARDIGVAIMDLTDPRILKMLASHSIELAEGVTSTLAQRMRSILLKALQGDDGEAASVREIIRRNLPKLEGNVAKAFATKEQRAMTIARTETNWARQNGAFDEMKDAGVEYVEWVTSEDEAVRSEHQVVNGTIVPLGQVFANGLRYPMDPRGAPEQVINCRCGLLAAFKD